MRTINEISDAVRNGERITTEDAITLWREAPLWLLGELAVERKRKVSGEVVYYNRNVHIEPSNICLFNCEFCSFRRREGDDDAWFMTIDDIEARAMELQSKDITEVHIVGGVHPSHSLDTYCEMISRVKRALPHVSVKAYTAVELFYMIRKADVTVVEGLRRLVEAGMDSIPGGGAEIFDEELRAKICPDKCSSDEWLAVHRAAHHMGIHTNCTMLYGHIETIEQRVDHLNRLRDLQDYASGFDAFIPLKYRSSNNRMSEVGECSTEDDLRTIAMSRIFLDNIPHIKAYWVAYGKAVTELALAYGADDIDGTIDDSTKIYSMAGADQRPSMSVEELETLVQDAGFIPVERDTLYNIIDRDGSIAAMGLNLGIAATFAGGAVATAEESVNMATEAAETVVEAAAEAVTETTTEESSTESSPEEELSDGDRLSKAEELAAAAMGDDENTNTNNMTKSERVLLWLKRFWQGTKRAYRRFLILFHMLFIAIFLVLVVLLLHYGLEKMTRHGESIELPDFEGMTIDEAKDLAEELELELIIREEIYDDEMEPGLIIDQDPSLSDVRTVMVKPGRRIYVTIITDERDDVRVPYVARQPLTPALQRLLADDFTIEELVFDKGSFSNQVLSQMVNDREMNETMDVVMPRGSGVTLKVSYTSDDTSTKVPLLAGMSLKDARILLWESGLNVGDITYDSSVNPRDRRSARVYMQSVGPKVTAPYGEVVSLYLTEDEVLIDSMVTSSRLEAESNIKKRVTIKGSPRALSREIIPAEEVNTEVEDEEEIEEIEEVEEPEIVIDMDDLDLMSSDSETEYIIPDDVFEDGSDYEEDTYEYWGEPVAVEADVETTTVDEDDSDYTDDFFDL